MSKENWWMEGIDWGLGAYQACAMATDGDLVSESAGHGNSASTIAYHIRPIRECT